MEFIRILDAGLADAHRLIAREPGSAMAAAVTALLKGLWVAYSASGTGRYPDCSECQILRAGRGAEKLRFCCFVGPSNTKFSCEDVFLHLQHITRRSLKGSYVMSKRVVDMLCVLSDEARM